MMVLGLLLLAAGVAFGVDFVFENTSQTPNPVSFGQSLGVHTAWWVFVIGAIAGAAALLGLVLMAGGAGRATARRRTRRAERRAEREDMAAAAAERDRLAAENERLRAERTHAAAPAGGNDPAQLDVRDQPAPPDGATDATRADEATTAVPYAGRRPAR